MHALIKSFLTAAALAAPLLAHPARAAVITYNLDTIVGGTLAPASGSYGTVTYADDTANPSTVDVTVSLYAGQKIQEFFFNYNDTKFSSATRFVFTGDVTTYSISENGTKADGYSTCMFDVQTPSNGNAGSAPITFNIALAGTNLDPGDFDFLDTSNKLYNVVHIGNCGPNSTGCLPGGGTGPASIFVGSSSHTTPVVTIAEPASPMLFGTGLIGVGVAAWLRGAVRPRNPTQQSRLRAPSTF